MLETQLAEFMVYIKKAEPFLKKLKEDLASYLSKKQNVMKSYGSASDVLSAYEESNLVYYTD